jgi:hypothetical protein
MATRRAMRIASVALGSMLACGLLGCGGAGVGAGAGPSGAHTVPPTPNPVRDIAATSLSVDLAAQAATAVITFAPSDAAGATLEIGDLDIDAVRYANADLPWSARGDRLDLGLPASAQPTVVTIRYRYRLHSDFSGASAATRHPAQQHSHTWPNFCGNLFPCHSQPVDGVDFALDVRNPPAGQRVIAASALSAAPAYQLAWSTGDYLGTDLGRTNAGTQLTA